MEGMLSPADVAVLSGNTNRNNDGLFGDNGAWWIIVLLLFGWGGNGFGRGFGGNSDGGQGAAYYYGGLGMPNIYGKLDGITYGISDATFALNNSITNGFSQTAQTLCQGFSGVNNAIAQNGFNTERGLWNLSSQFADCCCQTQRAIDKCCCDNLRAIDGVNFNLSQLGCGINNAISNSTRDILESNNNNTRAILDFLTKDKIDTLQTENQSLRLAASQAQQNAFITANQEAQTAELIRRLGADCPQPAYLVNGPTPINFPTNCCGQVQFANNNCGCNNY